MSSPPTPAKAACSTSYLSAYFFSSRRRHTRCLSDWSSDVCSSDLRLLPTYYRGCWHVVSRSCFCRYRHYLPCRKSFTPRRASSLTRRRCIRVSPIVQDSPLLPPV